MAYLIDISWSMSDVGVSYPSKIGKIEEKKFYFLWHLKSSFDLSKVTVKLMGIKCGNKDNFRYEELRNWQILEPFSATTMATTVITTTTTRLKSLKSNFVSRIN